MINRYCCKLFVLFRIYARIDQPGRIRMQQYLADRSCTEATPNIRTQNMSRQITSQESLPRAEKRRLKKGLRFYQHIFLNIPILFTQQKGGRG
ncbi:hypothetical protein GQ457_03G013050 [Hibiscus cannabinus]